jgi:hypothetical protein
MGADYRQPPTHARGDATHNARMWPPAGWLLAGIVFPLLLAAGLADWACHRATGIARTSGLRENLLHWVMYAEIGIGAAAVAFLEITAAVLLLVAAVFVVHEATVWIDLRTTIPLRKVSPVEQMVHSFQEMLPLASLLLLATMAWDQALAIVGAGPAPADWTLRAKAQPLPWPLLAAGIVATLLFNVVPLAQETAACLVARRKA